MEVYGCTDSYAINYDASATAPDGSCIARRPGCTNSASETFSPIYNSECTNAEMRTNGCLPCIFPGCIDSTNPAYNPTATYADGTCEYIHDALSGCTDSRSARYNAAASTDDGSCRFGGCIDSAAPNYDPTATYSDGSCVSAVPGCTDSLAEVYRAEATSEDGSCLYVGCTDSLASVCTYACMYTYRVR